MADYKKVIFVSTENTCLSPMAATIMLSKKDVDVEVQSRGLVVLFPEPPNQKAAVVAKKKGTPFTDHVSRKLVESDFGENVLILVMSLQNKQKIYDEFKDAVNVYTIREFVGEIGDVKTPYGGGIPAYEECYDSMDRLISQVIEKIYGDE